LVYAHNISGCTFYSGHVYILENDVKDGFLKTEFGQIQEMKFISWKQFLDLKG